MKTPLILSLALLTVSSLASAADTTVTMKGVHNCCKSCTNGITKAGTSVKDVTVTAEGETVTIVAKSKEDATKAVDAIIAAGYYGTSDAATPAAPKADKKVTSVTVSGTHMCCGKCVKAATAAVEKVSGVTKATIVAKEPTFTVEGNFSQNELLAALEKAGFEGTIK